MTRREALFALAAAPAQREPLTYLLASIKETRRVETHWPDEQRPLPFGSLLKPFLAVAHGAPYPEIVCTGCWKPGGHGRLSLPEAVAHSCNAYFLALARDCALSRVESVASLYGLPSPPSQPEAWIGVNPEWTVSAAALLRAYAELPSRAPKELLRGMRLSAQRGTAKALAIDAYAKTGTAPCIHGRGSGDGYLVALFPAPQPGFVLLAGCHNRPGSETARAARALLREGNFSTQARV